MEQNNLDKVKKLTIQSILLQVIAVVALGFLGNRVFNHVHAWAGIAILFADLALIGYFIKTWINHFSQKQ